MNPTSYSIRTIALAGNPNVGKSTVFNALTGLKQHTGNWAGKTVASAQGTYQFQDTEYHLVDLPGTYSLMAHSKEEEIARDFILFGQADATIVVCDATCLERNLNLVIQVMEITANVIVCVNLLDEAKKRGITIDLPLLAEQLGVPVVGTSARSGKGLSQLIEKTAALCSGQICPKPTSVPYPAAVTTITAPLVQHLQKHPQHHTHSVWSALRILTQDPGCTSELLTDPEIKEATLTAKDHLKEAQISVEMLKDIIISAIITTAQEMTARAVTTAPVLRCSSCQGNCCDEGDPIAASDQRDRKIDRILTSRHIGLPIMLLLLGVIFWLTIVGSNYPSQLLSNGLFWIQDQLSNAFVSLGAPDWLHGLLVLGLYRVLAWVVSVMLPPMAIFFPLFTLLEDFGYLPRVAFNLDHHFKKAKTCGKQALTMCMGFGCNAAGVVGCRIIDSPRERLIAILTNNFVPCNGRFPTLIAIITMFFIGDITGLSKSLLSTALLILVILLGVLLTFWISRLLSVTLLKGEPSSFTLELPPYRTPQFGRILIRSLCDRTLFVLGRAIVVAAPAGMVIWLLANITVGDLTLLAHCAQFLDPLGRLLGMDGIILLAFILGFPANEIVVPIMIMAYLSSGSLIEFDNLADLKNLLLQHGWTWVTAVSTMLFCLVHWPCSTTCLTIKKETGSWKWTFLSIAIPTGIGMIICFLFTSVVHLLAPVC